MSASKSVIILVNDDAVLLDLWKDCVSNFLSNHGLQADIVTTEDNLHVAGLLKHFSEQNREVKLIIADDVTPNMTGRIMMTNLHRDKMDDDWVYRIDATGQKNHYADDIAIILASGGGAKPYASHPKEMVAYSDTICNLVRNDSELQYLRATEKTMLQRTRSFLPESLREKTEGMSANTVSIT